MFSFFENLDDKFVIAAEAHDKKYAHMSNVPIIKDANRVEQGEYLVTSRKNKIGTFNVRQCIAIYATNDEAGTHGLIHIDGHTELNSIGEFFSKLSGGKECVISIKVFGGDPTAVSSGLDLSAVTLNKIKVLLNGPNIKRLLKNKDIDSILANRNTELHDFVLDGKGNVEEGLASGKVDKFRALHAIQNLRRHGGYVGTYPAIEAYNGKNRTIYLDELAINKLKEYEKNPNRDKSGRVTHDTTDYTEYDAAIPEIINFWNKEIERLVSKYIFSVSSKKSLPISEEDLRNILKNISLYIGEGGREKNHHLMELIKRSNSVEDLKKKLQENITPPFATISRALDVACKYDENLNREKFLRSLAKSYAKRYGVKLSPQEITMKQYGGEISEKEFIGLLEKQSVRLASLIILNSQGGYSFVEDRPYKIDEALQAAKNISFELAEILQKVLDMANKEVEERVKRFSKDDLRVAFNQVLEPMALSLKKPTDKYNKLFKVYEIENYQDFKKFIKFL